MLSHAWNYFDLDICMIFCDAVWFVWMWHDNGVNNDDYPTDYHHHLLDNHGVSENAHYKIMCLSVCVESVCPVIYAVDELSPHCDNYKHAS